MKDTIEIKREALVTQFNTEDYQDMIAALKQACILIDNGYLRDPDWESMDWDQKMLSKQTLFYEQARAVLAKVL